MMEQREYSPRVLPDEIPFVDNFGEERVIHQNLGRKNGRRLQVKRQRVTAALALNKGIGVLIGEKIHLERIKRGWTLVELARKSGMGEYGDFYLKQRMWDAEKGSRKEAMRFGTLYAIALALGVEASTLLPTLDEIQHLAQVKKVTLTGVQPS
jgi:hypothetical protein